MSVLARHIKAAREAKGLTIEDVVDLAEVHPRLQRFPRKDLRKCVVGFESGAAVGGSAWFSLFEEHLGLDDCEPLRDRSTAPGYDDLVDALASGLVTVEGPGGLRSTIAVKTAELLERCDRLEIVEISVDGTMCRFKWISEEDGRG